MPCSTPSSSLLTPRQTFRDLYQYSITQRGRFFGQLFEYANLIHTGSCGAAVDESKTIDQVPRWFDGVFLNFAENVLYSRQPGDAQDHRGKTHREDGKVCITEIREGNTERREISWAGL